ncbi:hypothetical protein D7D52_17965 [Nocardia yunnanensis]|uniref:Uncharacterized protein n=1 Tax=Nocardia yunnanensis TaxID=2382165 RepID=A0A386ZCN7_9NOCA|nr:hypothetical protein [Nocardia yunnanensis]AYF75431.1 hypothetical protein D7D52_17965 [Nocardia yunnanensis]
MTTPGRGTTQQRRPASSPAAARNKRMFGPPDMFVWAPVLTLFLTAGIVGTIGQSIGFASIFVVVAVVLVVADMFFNR